MLLGGFGIATRLQQAALHLNACLLGQWAGGQILLANGPNGLTDAAAVVVRAVTTGKEVEYPRVARTARGPDRDSPLCAKKSVRKNRTLFFSFWHKGDCPYRVTCWITR